MMTFEIPKDLVAKLKAARHIAVMTGAGVSAESGIPTFRDAQTGLWAKYDAEELATPQAFSRNPGLVWSWYVWRRQLIAQAQPNAGHHALGRMEQCAPRFTLITQNVDGFHRLAGNTDPLELHGNIMQNQCFREAKPLPAVTAPDQNPPRCPDCNGPVRPGVVWFGEPLPGKILARAAAAAKSCDVFFSVGTSGLVQPAASLAFEALAQGAVVIEVNPEETPLTPHVPFSLRGPGGQILPALVDAVWPPK